jgi:hypothetical protein
MTILGLTLETWLGWILSLTLVGGLLYWGVKDMPPDAFVEYEEDSIGLPDHHYKLLKVLGQYTRENDMRLDAAAFVRAVTRRYWAANPGE